MTGTNTLRETSTSEAPLEASKCSTCNGTGAMPSDYGPVDCSECGGSGASLPKKAQVDARMADLEKAYAGARNAVATDVRWMLTELRGARSALKEIVALAHDVRDEDAIALKIRMIANTALGQGSSR